MDSTNRFSDKVDNYIKFRPSYPKELIAKLLSLTELHAETTIADIGSGTGKLSELLFPYCSTLYAIEPNDPMRKAAEDLLGQHKGFKSIGTTAENTGLPDAAVDIITCAQAFHWFDRDACKTEFQRILKPEGLIVLIWNERLVDTDFLKAYEQLIIDYATDYTQIDHRQMTTEIMDEFFAPESYEFYQFHYPVSHTYSELEGRLLSSPYIIGPDHPEYKQMLFDLKSLFNRYQEDGKVFINYDSHFYINSRN